MKKMKFVSALAVLFIAFSLFSCSTEIEPVDPALINGENGNGGGGNGGGNNGGGTSTGDYWPMTVNNQWTFIKDAMLQSPMKIIGTEQIGGMTYYEYDSFFGTSLQGLEAEGGLWTRKENGNYYARQEINIPAQGGQPAISVSPLEIIILKDNIDINQTWTQNLTQTTTIQGFPPMDSAIIIEGTILEKDITITINGIVYTNVIKVELVQTTQGITQENYYWFAKDIGPIKYQFNYMGTETINELSTFIVN